MILKSITLHNFRNFADNTFYFHPFLTSIIGKNSVGKTNILESIHYVLTGRGFKNEQDLEMVLFEKNKFYVKAKWQDMDDIVEYATSYSDNKIKTYMINKIKRSYEKYIDTTPPVVFFTPEKIETITKNPSGRRTLIDHILIKLNKSYKQSLTNYGNGLKRRNKLLEKVHDIDTLKSELKFWNTYCLQNALHIQEKRKALITKINLKPNFHTFSFQIRYIQSEISLAKLTTTLPEQMRLRSTFFGPQRDDYEFINITDKKNPINICKFGSRSQQRIILLWLLIREIARYKIQLKKQPILLLDDIFSELDQQNSLIVIKQIQKYQTILTTTEAILLKQLGLPFSSIEL